jgi:hypothetical protein
MMDFTLILAIFLMVSILWFGCTFLYFLKVIRENSSKKIDTIYFLKNINNITNIYKEFLKIQSLKNDNQKLSYFIVISNIACFFLYAAVIIFGILFSLITGEL